MLENPTTTIAIGVVSIFVGVVVLVTTIVNRVRDGLDRRAASRRPAADPYAPAGHAPPVIPVPDWVTDAPPGPASLVWCPWCGDPNPPGSLTCDRCGAFVGPRCPHCGTAREPAARFCRRCGSSFAGQQR